MGLPSASPLPSRLATRPLPRGQESLQLRGRWLILARVVWIAIVALTVGLFFASIPAYYAYFLHALQCGAACPPSNGARLPPDYAQQIRALGLSLESFATYSVLLYIFLACCYFVVGGVLFWRTWGRTKDFMAPPPSSPT